MAVAPDWLDWIAQNPRPGSQTRTSAETWYNPTNNDFALDVTVETLPIEKEGCSRDGGLRRVRVRRAVASGP